MAALVVAGLAAGILGSRLLPPIAASMTRSFRTRQGHDPFELLIEDHRQILSTLDEMVDVPTESTARRAKQFLMLKRKLAKHAMAEEDVVYPLWRIEGKEEQASKELYEEHADMKIRLFELENLLKKGQDWRAECDSLRSLIREHAHEEETVVFPHLKQLLNQDYVATVSGQISREEAMVL